MGTERDMEIKKWDARAGGESLLKTIQISNLIIKHNSDTTLMENIDKEALTEKKE